MRSIEFSFPKNNTLADIDAAVRAPLGEVFIGISGYGPDQPAVVWLQDQATDKDMQKVADILNQPIPVIQKIVKTPVKLANLSLEDAKLWVEDNVNKPDGVQELMVAILEKLYT